MKIKNKNRDFIFTFILFGVVLVISFLMWHFMERKIKNELSDNSITTKYYVQPAQPIKEIVKYCIENLELEVQPHFYLSNDERYIVESIVAGEAGHEPLLGKMAVAQCILNACNRDGIQPSEVKTKYKYSGWKDIDKFETNYPEMTEEVKHAVWAVFDNGEVVTQDNILWFYSPNYSKGLFHNTQKFSLEIGGHRFYAPWE